MCQDKCVIKHKQTRVTSMIDKKKNVLNIYKLMREMREISCRFLILFYSFRFLN